MFFDPSSASVLESILSADVADCAEETSCVQNLLNLLYPQKTQNFGRRNLNTFGF
jgi:hypothetical protein